MRNRSKIIPTLLVAVLMVAQFATIGCGKSVHPHPNQLNTLDGQAYDRLTEAQAALDEAKAQYAAAKLPQTAMVKAIINDAGAAYETARTSWMVYRDVLQGTTTGDPTAAQAALQQNMTSLAVAIAKVVQLTSGGKP
jgi:uncharacterized MAPEG superfamily protein